MFVTTCTRIWKFLFPVYCCLYAYTAMCNTVVYLEILLKVTTVNITGDFLIFLLFYFNEEVNLYMFLIKHSELLSGR